MKQVSLFAAVAVLLSAAPAFAAPADSLSYALSTPPASLEVGCQGPCECAVEVTPTYGSFDLIRVGADASFTYYEIHRYIASFNNGPGAVSLMGTGTLKIDSIDNVQQMTLDLDVWGQPEHFDSGVQPMTESFPYIHASCAVHGFACMDSVLVVDATPLEQTGVPPIAARVGIQAIWPDPFEHGTSVWFDLGHESAADLRIVDAAGRVVRTLSVESGAGPKSVTWDGRTDGGRAAPAGVYWAVLRWSGGADKRRLVKLD